MALPSEQARIEEAHDTLLDPIRRKAYDASTFPDEAEEQPRRPSVPDLALEAEREMLRRELSREINAETEFTGALLRKVRESQGVELEDIVGQSQNDGIWIHGSSRSYVYTLDPAVSVRRNYENILGDQRAQSSHVADHRTPLDLVGPNRPAFHERSRRLQP